MVLTLLCLGLKERINVVSQKPATWWIDPFYKMLTNIWYVSTVSIVNIKLQQYHYTETKFVISE